MSAVPVTAASLPLHELLTHVVKEPPYRPNEPEEFFGYGDFMPSDIWPSDPDPTTKFLRLHPKAAEIYVNCLHGMLRASADGDLEHLTDREIKQSLWRFVSEAWLERKSTDDRSIAGRVQGFISEISRPQQDWEVLWEIDLLEVSEPVSVGAVEIFSFSKQAVAGFSWPEGHPWIEVEESLNGRAFARTTVLAGTKEKAVLRGKPVIDDALDILRVAISEAPSVPEFQSQQARGLHYYAYPKGKPSRGGAGAERTSLQASLGIKRELLAVVKGALDRFGPVLDDELPKSVREPVRRALMAIGQSMARADVDTRILDLCSALESLLSTAKDPLKAQRIALRYMLVGLANGDSSFVTHPLAIYDLYMKRNDIIHGSARRVCTEADYADLLYVAKDATDRVIEVAQSTPDIDSLNALFTDIETVESLKSVSEFLGDYPVSNDDAAKEVRKLNDWWLARANLRVVAGQHGYQLREAIQRGEYQVVIFPIGAKMQKSIDTGTAVVVKMSDPDLALQEGSRQLEALVGDEGN